MEEVKSYDRRGAEHSRYHLTEDTVEVDGRQIGEGWLLITEAEYEQLTTDVKLNDARLREAFDAGWNGARLLIQKVFN